MYADRRARSDRRESKLFLGGLGRAMVTLRGARQFRAPGVSRTFASNDPERCVPHRDIHSTICGPGSVIEWIRAVSPMPNQLRQSAISVCSHVLTAVDPLA